MNRIIFTLLLLCPLLPTHAQDLRVIDSTRMVVAYDYILYQQMNRRGVPVTQTMELRIGYRVSKFGHTTNMVNDSIIYFTRDSRAALEMVLSALSQNLPSTLANFSIYKNYPRPGDITFNARISRDDPLQVVEHMPVMEWDLVHNRDTVILGFRCAMATTSFRGRDYIAWFTKEVPVSDGPYKFSGLPGLILHIGSTDGEHVFTASSISACRKPRPIWINKEHHRLVSPRGFWDAFMAERHNWYSSIQRGEGGLVNLSPEDQARVLRNIRNLINFIERFE